MFGLFEQKPKRPRYVVVTDDVLVIDLSKAKSSGVLRLALSELPVANFYVHADEQSARLGFTTGHEDFVLLGVFADRHEAEELLKEIRKEIMKIEKMRRFFKLRTLFMGLIILLIINIGLSLSGLVVRQFLPQVNAPMAFDDMRSAPPALPIESGQPMDADSRLIAPE